MPKKNGHDRKRGGSMVYRSYNFVDKDPVIDKVRTIVKDEGLSHSEIHVISGVAASTLHNWFEGATRKPQHATVCAIVYARGYREEFVKTKDINFEREIKKAKLEIEEAAKGK